MIVCHVLGIVLELGTRTVHKMDKVLIFKESTFQRVGKRKQKQKNIISVSYKWYCDEIDQESVVR